jgi:hypothetical protein
MYIRNLEYETDVIHTVTHMNGNNNDAVNTKLEVVFEGAEWQ